MPNPFRMPRPTPINPEDLGSECQWEDLVSPDALRSLIEVNHEWLCHVEHRTGEIYRTLFHLVDPDASHQCETMSYLNEALWNLGFRTVVDNPRNPNPIWRWSEVM